MHLHADEKNVFTLFPKLPPELRDRIWRHAIPHATDDSSAVFFHCEEHFTPWYAQPGDPVYGITKSNLFLRYFYEKLDAVPVDLPLLKVNQEAHTAACFYAPQLGYEIFQNKEQGCPIIARRMNPSNDILYFEYGEAENMIVSGFDQMEALDEVYSLYPTPKHWGICGRNCLSHDDGYINEMLDFYDYFHTVHVFISDRGGELQRRNHGGVQATRIEPDTCGEGHGPIVRNNGNGNGEKGKY